MTSEQHNKFPGGRWPSAPAPSQNPNQLFSNTTDLAQDTTSDGMGHDRTKTVIPALVPSEPILSGKTAGQLQNCQAVCGIATTTAQNPSGVNMGSLESQPAPVPARLTGHESRLVRAGKFLLRLFGFTFNKGEYVYALCYNNRFGCKMANINGTWRTLKTSDIINSNTGEAMCPGCFWNL